MANPEHLEILKRGVEAWNQWREKNPDVKPDLSGAQLADEDLCTLSSDPDAKGSADLRRPVKSATTLLLDSGPSGLEEDRSELANEARSSGINFSKVMLEGADLSGARLIGANVSRANLKNAVLDECNLGFAIGQYAVCNDSSMAAANLSRADFKGAYFQDVDLSEAHIQEADLSRAHFRAAILKDAVLFNSVLTEASLRQVDLSGATLWGADLREARLDNSIMSGTDLRTADMRDAAVYGIEYDRSTRCRGIRVATAHGSPRFTRFAQDQDYIEEFKDSKYRRPLYWLWLITSDCGRSFGLWATWSVALALGFGTIFYALGESAFKLEELSWSLGTTLYYSVVTFTTLGFGDIVPRNEVTAGWVMAEVIVGYIMLGGLISILATKIARRS